MTEDQRDVLIAELQDKLARAEAGNAELREALEQAGLPVSSATDPGKSYLERLQQAQVARNVAETLRSKTLGLLREIEAKEELWTTADMATYKRLKAELEGSPIAPMDVVGKAPLYRATKRAQLLAEELAEALAVLREVEWVHLADDSDGIPGCPFCGRSTVTRDADGNTEGGHASDCRLAKILEGK
jgi:hypothetical protein